MRIQSYIKLSIFLILSTITCSAYAGGFYIGVHGGHSYVDDEMAEATVNGTTVAGTPDTRTDLSFGASMGYVLPNDWIRLEAEVNYRSNDIVDKFYDTETLGFENGNIDVYSTMANAYIDIPTTTPVRPYIGAGIGMSHIDLLGYKDSVISFQGLAGASYTMKNGHELYAGYRYLQTGEANFNVVDAVNGTSLQISTHYTTQNFEAGYRFPLTGPLRKNIGEFKPAKGGSFKRNPRPKEPLYND